MKPEDIHLYDWQRILMGDVPGAFYVELLIRAAFGYFLLIASMRLMGSRMSSQLNRIELAALVSLAAAVGVPLMSPDRGLLPAVVVSLVVVLVVRGITRLTAKNPKMEFAVDGSVSVLVDDSCLQFEAMGKTRVTRERIFAHLRSEGLTHLGKVKRLYLEANGSFTIVPTSEPRPGLSIIPEWDADFVRRQPRNGQDLVCHDCGCHGEPNREGRCQNCGASNWVNPIA
jgi:uncharacterized membrane protein YcaP (DUF421 family)